MLPFLPSLDFSVLTLCAPALLTVFSATFCPAAAALDAAALLFDAAFLAVDLAFVAAFFAEDFALVEAFLADDLVFAAGFLAFDAAFFAPFFATEASNFLEIAALTPAFASPFELSLIHI